MTDKYLDDLRLAAVNSAKIENVEKFKKEGLSIINDIRVNIQIREEVKNTLSKIEQLEDFEITPTIVSEIDTFINNKVDLVVSNNVTSVSGTENFGLTLTPSQWRLSRVAGLENILVETYKNIKRWANQLQENFNRRWIEFSTSINILEDRMKTINETSMYLSDLKEGMSHVELNELLVKSISKKPGIISGGSNIAAGIYDNVNFIITILKLWEQEEVRFKNSIIKYFGNKNEQVLSKIVFRNIPKVFFKQTKLFDTSEPWMVTKATEQILDGFHLICTGIDSKWIKANVDSPDGNNLYCDYLSKLKFELIKDTDLKYNKIKIPTFTYDEIMTVKMTVDTLISILKNINKKDQTVDLTPEDVKDVLNSIKNEDTDDGKPYQYGLVTTSYQLNVDEFKSSLSSYFTILASHLITLINLNMECYNVEKR